MAETSLGRFSAAERLNAMAVDLIDVALTRTGTSVADGQVISESIEIPNAVAVTGGSAIIQSIILHNRDDDVESPAIELLFEPNDMSAGTMAGISDDESITIQGAVTISNWSTLQPSANEIAFKSNIGMVVKAASDSRSIYVTAINRSGAAYTPSSVNSLTAKIGIVKD
tara:strand:+ start:28 stop:534 length:507 start_codon:yes stop_codon:yes gene_type:complete